MDCGYIKLSRNEKVDELIIHYPNAFLLVTLIARRARRRVEGLNRYGLEMGEALIGDHGSAGLTRQNYRTAMQQLDRFKIATFKATNKGTIARLLDSTVYDINEEAPNQLGLPCPTSAQPAANHRVTTNEEGKEGKKGKKRQGAAVATLIGEPFPEVLNTPEFRIAWTEYLAYRRGRKLAAYTEPGAAMKLKEISFWGVDVAIEAIHHSMANNWQGIFQKKGVNGHSKPGLRADPNAKFCVEEPE